MINANELRLGNVVNFNYKCDRIGTICWIQPYSVSLDFLERAEDLVNGIIASPKDLIPISLTSEILLKCGFKKTEWPDTLIYDAYFFNIETGQLLFNDEIPVTHIEIKYLHHLQNIYFALNQKELIYTP